jgi:hypothetical protein
MGNVGFILIIKIHLLIETNYYIIQTSGVSKPLFIKKLSSWN